MKINLGTDRVLGGCVPLSRKFLFFSFLTLSARADVYIRQYTIRDDVYVRRFSTISTRLIVQARILSVT